MSVEYAPAVTNGQEAEPYQFSIEGAARHKRPFASLTFVPDWLIYWPEEQKLKISGLCQPGRWWVESSAYYNLDQEWQLPYIPKWVWPILKEECGYDKPEFEEWE